MTKGIRRKRLVRCVSCRTLKIKCDQKRPTCEYCLDTGRECVYISNEAPIEQPNQISIETPRKTGVGSVNDVSSLDSIILGIFREKYLHLLTYGSREIISTWRAETNELLVDSTHILTKSYLAMGALMLLYFEDEDVVQEHAQVSDFTFKDLSSAKLVSTYGRATLAIKIINHFQEAIEELNKYITRAYQGKLSVTEYRELFATGMILHTYMVFDPLLPLLSFDPGMADYVSLASNFDGVQRLCISVSGTCPFHYYIINFGDVLTLDYPSNVVISQLKTQLDGLQEDGLLSPDEFATCNRTLQVFNSGLHRAISVGYPLPIFNTIISFGNDFSRLVHGNSNDFTLRLLFVYSCIAIFCKYYMKRNHNMWMDFILRYKRSEFAKYGRFRFPLDENLCCLATETNFLIRCSQLQDFDPETYASMYKPQSVGHMHEVT